MAIVVLTAVLAWATVSYVRKTQTLADPTEDSVGETRDLIENQHAARQQDHAAAVEAVFQEIVSIAKPMRLVPEHGTLDVQIPFALISAYRQVLGPLYRGLPPDLGERLARVYSLLDIRRGAFERVTVAARQFHLVYEEELLPTLAGLRQHLHDLGRDLPAPPAPIAAEDIALTAHMVQAVRNKRISSKTE